MTATSPHPVRRYVERVASQDLEEYPEWDLTDALPKLPVPDLQTTLGKYLLCIEPLVSREQYDVSKGIVTEFGKPRGTGEYLQEELQRYAQKTDNWIYQFWLDEMYSKNPLPLPVNSNPGMVFPRQTFADKDEQLRYAARLISGILDYKLIIDTSSMPVDRARHSEKGQPLCMEQYYRLFNTYRVPGVKKDVLVSLQERILAEPEHIIVMCKNQVFMLPVVVNFSRLSVDNLYTQLRRIVKHATDEQNDISRIGILTAQSRDRWATTRMRLMEDSGNRECLDKIERCIFVLCLDDATQSSTITGVPTGASHPDTDVTQAMQMLHGQGSARNSCNRWFDKTMQFIIGEDGACGLCYEHSPSEGIAVVQLIEHLLRYMDEVKDRKLPRMLSICELQEPRKLHWKVTKDTEDDIALAITDTDNLINDMDLHIIRFNNYGKNFPKSQNMSPDAYIQLSLQLTYYKVHHCLVSTYESASIRRFRLGRVDNIRACTLEALQWVKAMTGEVTTTDQEKLALMKKAMNRQTDILLQTILGHGIDNHLLGLKSMAEKLGMVCPDLFSDESYRIANHFTMSTSQVPTSMDAFMCYGPVVPDGYGICYNPHQQSIRICISSFKSSPATDSNLFATTLQNSLLEMRELCERLHQQAIR